MVNKEMVEVGSNYNSVKSFTSGDLRILLVVIQLGVTGISCQSDYLTIIFAKYFLGFMESVRQVVL